MLGDIDTNVITCELVDISDDIMPLDLSKPFPRNVCFTRDTYF